jgi:hypothetical protein
VPQAPAEIRRCVQVRRAKEQRNTPATLRPEATVNRIATGFPAIGH